MTTQNTTTNSVWFHQTASGGADPTTASVQFSEVFILQHFYPDGVLVETQLLAATQPLFVLLFPEMKMKFLFLPIR